MQQIMPMPRAHSPQAARGVSRFPSRTALRAASIALFGIAAAAAALAQPVTLNGPVQGYIFDAPTGSLRAVIGLPGSAMFGPSLVDGLDFGWVAPHQNYAVAFQSGNCVFVSGLDSTSPSTTIISGVPRRGEGVLWSADGSVAMVYSQRRNWIQTLTGFPSAPTAATYLNLATLGGPLSAAASDPHGDKIAIALSGAGGGVFLTDHSQAFVPVLHLLNVSALSFSPDGSSLYALDTSTPQLSVVDLNTLTSQNLPLDGLVEPVAIQPDQSAQGREIVYVASGSDQLLRIIDVAAQQVVTDVPLSVAPSRIDTLGRDSFVVAARSQAAQPLWLFSANPQPGAYFVPAVNAAAGGLQ